MSGNLNGPVSFSAGTDPGESVLSPSDRGQVPGVDPAGMSEEDKAVVRRAQKFHKDALTWEAVARSHWIDDTKFDAGDAYNQFQWPNAIRASRDVDDRPCITVNKARQHNLMIINDAKQNKPEVKLRPTGGQATLESATALEGIIRHIQYAGQFSQIHDGAVTHQVRAGLGVYRVITKWADENSMEQEIAPEAIRDPLSVLFDPDAKLPDKSDGRRAMLFEDLRMERFKELYPQYAPYYGRRGITSTIDEGWVREDYVRICEYFEKVEEKFQLIRFRDPANGQLVTMDMDLVPEVVLDAVQDHPDTQMRDSARTKVMHYVIVGNSVAETNVWPGKYIPLVPVIGEETIIEGKMDRKGHTRAMLDPQRMYNYWASAAVEFGALQTKSPFIGAAEAIEGHEPLWNSANKKNYSVLIYNAFDDQDRPLAPPQRPQLPEQSPLYLQGMQTSMQEMMMVSGQYQSQMGAPGNERSGKAIQERQRQGDNATYHFIDNSAIAVRLFGLIVLDLIPKVYTQERVLTVLAQNGKDTIPVKLDPNAQQAYIEELDQDQQIAQRILNPNVGTYSVQSDIGPAYATAREEAFNAMTQILTQAPELTALIGDILFSNADFPGADEIASRMKRMVNPQALGQAPPPAQQQLAQQLQEQTEANKLLMERLAKVELKLAGKNELRDIDVYKAETERLSALAKAGGLPPEVFGTVLEQLIHDAVRTHLSKVSADTEVGMVGGGNSGGPMGGGGVGLGAMAVAGGGADNPNTNGTAPASPIPGARQAPDGQWYMPDPSRPGKFLRIKPEG